MGGGGVVPTSPPPGAPSTTENGADSGDIMGILGEFLISILG